MHVTFALVLLLLVHKVGCDCPHSWNEYRDICYKLITVKLPYGYARTNCQSRGGELLIIDSDELWKLTCAVNTHTWIGLIKPDLHGKWEWSIAKSLDWTSTERRGHQMMISLECASIKPDGFQEMKNCHVPANFYCQLKATFVVMTTKIDQFEYDFDGDITALGDDSRVILIDKRVISNKGRRSMTHVVIFQEEITETSEVSFEESFNWSNEFGVSASANFWFVSFEASYKHTQGGSRSEGRRISKSQTKTIIIKSTVEVAPGETVTASGYVRMVEDKVIPMTAKARISGSGLTGVEVLAKIRRQAFIGRILETGNDYVIAEVNGSVRATLRLSSYMELTNNDTHRNITVLGTSSTNTSMVLSRQSRLLPIIMILSACMLCAVLNVFFLRYFCSKKASQPQDSAIACNGNEPQLLSYSLNF